MKTLRIDDIWNFATFNLHTAPEKILYLQRCSTDFRNLYLSSKILREGTWVESFISAGILLLQWQGENFAHRQHLKFCYFQPVHCASKNPISPMDSTDFRNLGLCSNMLRECIWVKSFRCASILLLQWQGERFGNRQHFKFSCFEPVHCASKSAISPMVFNRFSKSLPLLEDVEGGRLVGKPHVRRYFAFAMARWKLCSSITFDILPLSTCTLFRPISYISKGIKPIFEIFHSARRYWGRAFGGKVSYAQVF